MSKHKILYQTYNTDNRPEADPAVLLAWVETADDLATIHKAAKVTIGINDDKHCDFFRLPLTTPSLLARSLLISSGRRR